MEEGEEEKRDKKERRRMRWPVERVKGEKDFSLLTRAHAHRRRRGRGGHRHT